MQEIEVCSALVEPAYDICVALVSGNVKRRCTSLSIKQTLLARGWIGAVPQQHVDNLHVAREARNVQRRAMHDIVEAPVWPHAKGSGLPFARRSVVDVRATLHNQLHEREVLLSARHLQWRAVKALKLDGCVTVEQQRRDLGVAVCACAVQRRGPHLASEINWCSSVEQRTNCANATAKDGVVEQRLPPQGHVVPGREACFSTPTLSRSTDPLRRETCDLFVAELALEDGLVRGEASAIDVLRAVHELAAIIGAIGGRDRYHLVPPQACGTRLWMSRGTRGHVCSAARVGRRGWRKLRLIDLGAPADLDASQAGRACGAKTVG